MVSTLGFFRELCVLHTTTNTTEFRIVGWQGFLHTHAADTSYLVYTKGNAEFRGIKLARGPP